MSDQTDPAPAQHTLHGDDLSWLHLMVEGALPAVYALSTGSPAAPAPTLVIPDHQLTVGQQVDLLDPEGATLATLAVAAVDGPAVAGPVTVRSGFSIVDHLQYRSSPAATATAWPSGPVWALWCDAPVPYVVRETARAAARDAGAAIAEIIPIPTGRETSRIANRPARLAMAASTHDSQDRIVVVPWPDVPWDAAGVSLRARVAAAYGATELLTVSGPELSSSEGTIPVRHVDVPVEQRSIPEGLLDAWVGNGQTLPSWAAEPPVASELLVLHRPGYRSGLTVLLSGLSGSGKSTVARALAVRLVEHESRSVSLLDGDVVRHHLSKGLGFSRTDRITNVLRIGFVASEITKAGGVAVCCPIAPYDETRREVRAMIQEHGTFVLVHVATPLEECERRDRKGLYAKARRGEIPEFTGISDPYDIPTDAEIVVDTTGRTIDACVDDVYNGLVELGALAAY